MRFELTANILIAYSILLYLAGWAVLVRHKLQAGRMLIALAWAGTVAQVVVNGFAVQGPPLGNMYQVLTVLSLCFFPLFLFLTRRTGMGWAAPYFTIMAMLPLAGGFFMEKDALWRRMPALQSHWFIPHVLAYMIAYALATVAVAFLTMKWMKRRCGTEDGRHDEAAHETLRLAFPFMTFGMLSGALWAERAWGQYWSWDPKETWSLIMWMLYVIYLHAWKSRDLRKYADIAHLLGYLALLITFLLVNLLPRLASLLHGYA
jgi:ABC-type transport system involved in cytochrome c biogenesis permease subunit